ncbi:unnamed protein product [Linum trigynum]|uniref:Uncharacterized protein n=1 Tax=Linum trigynum TaxID=586398 RepID=A0AAV2CTB2_9ROSI
MLQAMIDPKYVADMNEFVEGTKKLVDTDLWKDMQKTLVVLVQATTVRDIKEEHQSLGYEEEETNLVAEKSSNNCPEL